jgi:hypothetical protein
MLRDAASCADDELMMDCYPGLCKSFQYLQVFVRCRCGRRYINSGPWVDERRMHRYETAGDVQRCTVMSRQ